MKIKKLIPVGLLIAGLILALIFDVGKYLSFEAIGENYAQLKSLIEQDFIISLLLFAFVYILVVAFSIPGASALSLLYGALLGTFVSGTLIVIAATIGATIIFLAARYALSDVLREKAGPWLSKMQNGFNENAVSYLLFLRLVPAFPFFVVNLVPAFMGVSLRVYVLTTLFGIMPGTYVFASIGNGIGYVLEQGKTPDLSVLGSPEILLPLAGLGLLALIPIIFKKLKANKTA
ncbi:TVP38/TMEM64 family protein [Pseudemcibacter aquimaris]|uniref:TVP38/TMEM64 family protein n=1 Tax=Pseudemcibacter aquimaris TaxID=2857064 RepID=UPI0020125A89|nr:VTT domain-containing protein [Pseudemcibacter aquimaris]MCC3861417.1 VTT domain-containing protein [Pseudemcibacter aquimaris]WDU58187.1 VTT domain-containing protein [Pseudemcibacter aquimaris]